MKKKYIEPQGVAVNMELANGILAGSEGIKISKDPVDHFDANKMKEGKSPIWD